MTTEQILSLHAKIHGWKPEAQRRILLRFLSDPPHEPSASEACSQIPALCTLIDETQQQGGFETFLKTEFTPVRDQETLEMFPPTPPQS